jgi:type IV pilus assembly protein PilX
MNHLPPISQSKQSGFVMLTTLIFMIMLTVLALTQVSLNTSQTRVAANQTDTEITFEKTEGAINQAINNLNNGTYLPINFLNNNNGLYMFNPNAAPLWTTINWSSAGAVINSFQGSSGPQASYIIEKLPTVSLRGQSANTSQNPTNFYRITARSLGASGNSAVVIQTTLQVQ